MIVFNNRVLKDYIWTLRGKTVESRILYNEEFPNLYFSPTIRVINSKNRRICGGVDHAVCMEMILVYRILVVKT